MEDTYSPDFTEPRTIHFSNESMDKTDISNRKSSTTTRKSFQQQSIDENTTTNFTHNNLQLLSHENPAQKGLC
jgi:hypothetical protein